MEIFIGRDGKQLGPFSLSHLQELIDQKRVKTSDMAWYEGLDDWVPLSSVPGLEVAEPKSANKNRRKAPGTRRTAGKPKRLLSQKSALLSATTEEMSSFEYVGFWVRVVSQGLDGPIFGSIIFFIINVLKVGALVASFSGDGAPAMFTWLLVWGFVFPVIDLVLYIILAHIIEILFCVYLSATPGKLALRMKIVDAKTGLKPTATQFIFRSLAQWISLIPFGMGYLWVAFNRRKRGWHDIIAGTMVVMGQQGKRGSQQRKELKKKPVKTLSEADEITKLAELRDRGLLTEDEFEFKKRQILDL